MIWSYFPVGLSYSVDDFSEQTKKKCWEISLSALMAADPENRTEITFFDFCAHNYPGSSENEYVCILDHCHLSQSRINVPLFRSLDLLRTKLSLHYPFYMANALDDFGPYVALGNISEEGIYTVTEEGKGIIPEVMPSAMKKNNAEKVLVAMNAVPTKLGYAENLKCVADKLADNGKRIDFCPLANGGIGTTYAVTYAKEGRFEWLKGRKIPAYLNQVLLGILPDRTVIFDCAALNKLNVSEDEKDVFGKAVSAILDFGYRKIIFAIDGFSDQGSISTLFAEKQDARLKECDFTILTSNSGLINGNIVSNGTLWEMIRMGASLRYAPDYIAEILHLAERCKQADQVLLEKDSIPGVTEAFQNYLDDSKCKVISSCCQDQSASDC